MYGETGIPGDTAPLIFNAILERAPAAAVRLNPEVPAELEESLQSRWRKTETSVISTPRNYAPTFVVLSATLGPVGCRE